MAMMGTARMEVIMGSADMALGMKMEAIKMDMATMTPSPMTDSQIGLIPPPMNLILSSALVMSSMTTDLVASPSTVKEAPSTRSTDLVVDPSIFKESMRRRTTNLVNMSAAAAEVEREVEAAPMTTDL
jgi:hypothetical protein